MKARGITRETILDLGVQGKKHPVFKVGDTIEVGQILKEGDKERVQPFVGDVIATHNNGIASTITVRRIGAHGVGVEKIFPIYAPTISEIKLVKTGKVRRAKLYYLRERLGKAARIKEKVMTKAETEGAESASTQAAAQTPASK
jgi:large subunit ribosomal protein L19